MLTDRDFASSRIMAKVADHFGVSMEQIRGRRRFRKFTVPRHTVAWLMRRALFTLAEIGRELNRDHTTAHHGIQVIEKMRIDDPEGFGAEVDGLAEELGV